LPSLLEGFVECQGTDRDPMIVNGWFDLDLVRPLGDVTSKSLEEFHDDEGFADHEVDDKAYYAELVFALTYPNPATTVVPLVVDETIGDNPILDGYARSALAAGIGRNHVGRVRPASRHLDHPALPLLE
jgi:hypothetical protein